MNDKLVGRQAPRYPIGSVDNALKLLLMLRDEPQIRLTEASAVLDVAPSTAHRLLAMLEYHDFVRNDEGLRAYVAGRALTEIGLAVVQKMDIRATARPILQRLQFDSGETVHLAALEGVNVLYLDCVESNRALRVGARTGRALPAHCTSVGKAILAGLSEAEFDRIYPDESLPVQTSRSVSTKTELRRELTSVRRKGFASNAGESEEEVGSVGVALTGRVGGRLVGISLAAPLSRLDPRHAEPMVEMMKGACAELETRLKVADTQRRQTLKREATESGKRSPGRVT